MLKPKYCFIAYTAKQVNATSITMHISLGIVDAECKNSNNEKATASLEFI